MYSPPPTIDQTITSDRSVLNRFLERKDGPGDAFVGTVPALGRVDVFVVGPLKPRPAVAVRRLGVRAWWPQMPS